MNKRKFKDSSISEIGLGTWQLGGADWGNIDQEKAFAILNTFLQQGGNFIDTADVYGMGISERFIGDFFSQHPTEDIKIATKLGRRQDAPNGWPQNFTYDFMRKHLEESLERLRLSTVFLEQLHCIPFEVLKQGEVFQHLRSFQEEGLIQHWGVSVETEQEALFCLEQEGIASLQIIFNLFRQHLADELFEKAAQKEVALIIRVPLASGLLSGKFSEQTAFATSDHRNYNADGASFNVGETFSGVAFQDGLALVEQLKGILPVDGQLSQWALRWILDHPQVSTIIPGASSVQQVIQNVASASLASLSEKIHVDLRSLYDDQIRPKIRGQY